MENVKIGLVGFKGKMGSVVFEKLKNAGYDVWGITKGDDLEILKSTHLVVDFSTAEASVETAKWCEKNNIKLIIGATGQSDYELMMIKRISEKIPILMSGNYSIGIALLKKSLKNILNGLEQNIVIYESHHKNKIDKPSGTALMLENELKKLTNAKIEILSERGGMEVGCHKVNVYYENEMISVSHKAYSREIFALGVLEAVEFMFGVKDAKLYTFDDALKF